MRGLSLHERVGRLASSKSARACGPSYGCKMLRIIENEGMEWCAPLQKVWYDSEFVSGIQHARLWRGIPGIEPGTSRTLSENHAARPNPQLVPCRSAPTQGLCIYKKKLRKSSGHVHLHEFCKASLCTCMLFSSAQPQASFSAHGSRFMAHQAAVCSAR